MLPCRGRLQTLLLLAVLWPGLLPANNVLTVAVASNFASTAADIGAAFTEETRIPVRMSPGSTGKLYAQILNGAPYDIFLAADTRRPLLLEQQGAIAPGSRMTYAIGSLVLWSQDDRLRGKSCFDALAEGDFDRLALANPATAPYGAAAREFLHGENLWDSVAPRAVYGESIAQTLHFVASGNATLGFIAKAQTTAENLPAATCSWPVPESTHAPLRQQGVILRRAAGSQDARRFLEFMKTASVRQLIREHGYRVSE